MDLCSVDAALKSNMAVMPGCSFHFQIPNIHFKYFLFFGNDLRQLDTVLQLVINVLFIHSICTFWRRFKSKYNKNNEYCLFITVIFPKAQVAIFVFQQLNVETIFWDRYTKGMCKSDKNKQLNSISTLKGE